MLITRRQKNRVIKLEPTPTLHPQFDVVIFEEICESGNYHAVEFFVPLGKGEQLQKALQAVIS